MVVGGCGWLQMVVGGCGWLWLVVRGCGWLWLAVDGCGWLWMVVARFGWLWWVWLVAYFIIILKLIVKSEIILIANRKKFKGKFNKSIFLLE